jgi:hypothetical protein
VQPPAAIRSITIDKEKVRRLLGDFGEHPDDEHFKALLTQSRDSVDPLLMTLRDYDVYVTNEMTPVRPPADFDRDGVEKRLRERHPEDFALVAAAMPISEDLWRRWTMARFLGHFGGMGYLGDLEIMLRDKDPDMRREAQWAIDDMKSMAGAKASP